MWHYVARIMLNRLHDRIVFIIGNSILKKYGSRLKQGTDLGDVASLLKTTWRNFASRAKILAMDNLVPCTFAHACAEWPSVSYSDQDSQMNSIGMTINRAVQIWYQSRSY